MVNTTDDVLAGAAKHSVECGDCIRWLSALSAGSVDLVFGSPPYEDARYYGELDFRIKGQDWVDWMVAVYRGCLRVCRGLVAFVVGHGQTRAFRWSAVPALLMADLHRAGVCLRSPKWYHRFGIPGSGGPDDLKQNVEFIVCATNGGRLPWSCPTACGKPPKYAPGGRMSYRTQDGRRVSTMRIANGDCEGQNYRPPKLANPGNIVTCTVGGGRIGSKLAHENEAPFPSLLSDFFVQTFCPPGGIVLDCFSGSGTTGASAIRHGRRFIGCDIRQSQVDLSLRRIAGTSPFTRVVGVEASGLFS